MLLPCSGFSSGRALLTILLITISAISVLADTEIRNFNLPLPPCMSTRSIHPTTPIIDLPPTTSPAILNISSQNPEVWIKTPTRGGYTKWTARISWPGSTPTRFDMEVLPAPPHDTQSGDEVIIHLKASLLSPRFPRQVFSNSPIVPVTDNFYTTFALVVESLIFGVLPQTAVPALLWALVFGLGAACFVPYIIRYLETISIAEEGDTKLGKSA